MKMIPSNSENSNINIEPQDVNERDINNPLLEDVILYKDVTKKESVAGNVEEIRIDIEFDPIDGNEEVCAKEESLQILENAEEEPAFKEMPFISTADIQGRNIIIESQKCQTDAIDVQKDDQIITTQKENIEEYESGELLPTFTELIAEKEMDLMRKSLEEDYNAEGVDNNIIINIPDNNQVQSKNKNGNRSNMKKSYVDFLSDEEEFVWDSTSWKEIEDDSTSSETNKPQKTKKKKLSSENGKVGDAGVRTKKINKRKKYLLL